MWSVGSVVVGVCGFNQRLAPESVFSSLYDLRSASLLVVFVSSCLRYVSYCTTNSRASCGRCRVLSVDSPVLYIHDDLRERQTMPTRYILLLIE